MVFGKVYKQQRVLVAINRGEACEVVIVIFAAARRQRLAAERGRRRAARRRADATGTSASVWFSR